MSIKIEYIDTGIYVAHWQGRISSAEVTSNMSKIKALANDYGEQLFCLILDLTQVNNIPFDTAHLGQITESDAQNVCLIAINTQQLGDRFKRIVDQFTKQDYIRVDTYDEAVIQARALLKQQPEII